MLYSNITNIYDLSQSFPINNKKIAPIYSEAGFDIDYEWQLPLLKYWIEKKI